MTYFGLFTVMFSPQKIILYWYVSIDIMAPLSRPFGWSDWEYRFLFSVIKQDCKFFNLLLTCYSLFIRWGHEYDPGDFSAFKLSSLVIFPKNITPMVISTKMIYLILIFSCPYCLLSWCSPRYSFLFLNYIIKLYCFQYTSSYLHNA